FAPAAAIAARRGSRAAASPAYRSSCASSQRFNGKRLRARANSSGVMPVDSSGTPARPSRFDGAPDLEFRLATEALELEKSGLSYQRVPPGYRFPYGHTHKKQEEVYVVLRGSGRMKVDDEIVELKQWDAVRVPPGTWRGYEAGPEGLEILVIGAPNLGDAPREDVDGQRDWWV